MHVVNNNTSLIIQHLLFNEYQKHYRPVKTWKRDSYMFWRLERMIGPMLCNVVRTLISVWLIHTGKHWLAWRGNGQGISGISHVHTSCSISQLLPSSLFPSFPYFLVIFPQSIAPPQCNSSNEPKHQFDAFFCGDQHQDLISLAPSFSTSAVCDPVETITFKRSKNTFLLSFVRYQISQKCHVFKRH